MQGCQHGLIMRSMNFPGMNCWMSIDFFKAPLLTANLVQFYPAVLHVELELFAFQFTTLPLSSANTFCLTAPKEETGN